MIIIVLSKKYKNIHIRNIIRNGKIIFKKYQLNV